MSVESEAKVEELLESIREEKKNLIKSKDFINLFDYYLKNDDGTAHFIWEILQNAEDVDAEEISFILENKRLIVRHNGRVFSANNVISICSVGASTKKGEPNKIGKFGMGFKTVFKYTASPEVYSKDFRFRIEKFVYPSSIQKNLKNDYGRDTVFVIPFNHPEKKEDEAYSEIKEKLLSLSSASLLFLKEIQKITVTVENQTFTVTRKTKKRVNISDNLSLDNIEVTDRQGSKSYYRFTLGGLTLVDVASDGTQETVTNQSVMIAYSLDNAGKIQPCSRVNDVRNYFVFFPTDIETGLEYLIHAPFKTTPDRKSILSNDPANLVLYEKIAELVALSLLYLVKKKEVDNSFYDIILKDLNEELPLHRQLIEKIAKIIGAQYKVLPTSDNGYASLNELLFFTDAHPSPNEVKLLFPATEIAQNIENYKTKVAWNADNYWKILTFIQKYLTGYDKDSHQIRFEDFLSELTPSWLEKKNLNDILQLYTLLEEFYNNYGKNQTNYNRDHLLSSLSGRWRSLPLIRKPDGKHTSTNNPQGVYFRSEDIHPDILADTDACNILRKILGIREYDKKEDIKRNILSKYHRPDVDIPLSENVKDLKVILAALNNGEIRREDLEHRYIISGINAETGKIEWNKPDDVYCTLESGGDNPYVEIFLKGLGGFFFLNPKYQNDFNIRETFYKFGVHNEINLLSRPSSYYEYWYYKRLENEIREAHSGISRKKIHILNHLEGFCNASISESRYHDIFTHASVKYKTYDLYRHLAQNQNIIRGKVTWRTPTGDHSNPQEFTTYSDLGRNLRKWSWLVDKNGNLCSPESVTVDDLPDEYRRISESLLEKLGIYGAQPVNLQITGDDGEQKTVQISQKVYERTVQDIQEVEDNWKELLMADEPTGEDNPTVEDRPTIGFALAQENRGERTFDEEKYDASYISPVTNAERRSENIRSEFSERIQQYSSVSEGGRGGVADNGFSTTSTSSEIGLANTPIRIVSYDRNQLFICDSVKSNDKERRFLESQYKGVCQICGIRIKKGEPKSKDDFPYHYIARNVIRTKHLDEQIRMTEDVDAWNSLSLCPNCAAKYLFAEKDMSSFKEQVEKHEIEEGVSRFYDIYIKLEGRNERIRYKPKHLLALKTAFAYFAEKESEE